MRQRAWTRRALLASAGAAACRRVRNEELIAGSLPVRPDAAQASPTLVRRWNAMFSLTGPHRLDSQRQMHADVCDETADCQTKRPVPNVHYTPDFVLWHRAFLYYHEQILSALESGNAGIAYWDWSTARLCPLAYQQQPFSFGNHLYRSPNELGDENFTPEQVIRVVALLRKLPPADAAMELYDQPIHKFPHSRLGWRRPNDLAVAAGDPLFYGHHANLDRLAQHIFQSRWPEPTGAHYRFYDGQGKEVCTTLDRFASMPSTYAGDRPIDTSAYTVGALADLERQRLPANSRARLAIQFKRPLPMGIHRLISGKGAFLGEIASIHHTGEVKFVFWASVENARAAKRDGIKVTIEGRSAELMNAYIVMKGE
jgi:hypothetical protein